MEDNTSPSSSPSSGPSDWVLSALKSSTLLYQTVDSYHSHFRKVRDLKDELDAVALVLQTLSMTVEKGKDAHFTTLKLPLLRCGNACKQFQDVITKYISRPSGSQTSFSDWENLRYMGDGIDKFREMLAGYKSIMNIGLANAHFYQFSVPSARVERYEVLLKNATTDLEYHLACLDEKLQSAISRAAHQCSDDETQIQQIQDERLSTQQGLAICAQLSAQIAPILAERVTEEGLEANANATKVDINIFQNIDGGMRVFQMFASTTGMPVHAKQISLGDGSVQCGGQFSDASIQRISRDYARRTQIASTNPTSDPVPSAENEGGTMFLDRYGSGRILGPQPSQSDRFLLTGQAGQVGRAGQAEQTERRIGSSIPPSL